MILAVVGATGLVGTEMLNILEERNFFFNELLLVASERSVGKKINYKGQEYSVIGMQDAVDRKPDRVRYDLWSPQRSGWICGKTGGV